MRITPKQSLFSKQGIPETVIIVIMGHQRDERIYFNIQIQTRDFYSLLSQRIWSSGMYVEDSKTLLKEFLDNASHYLAKATMMPNEPS